MNAIEYARYRYEAVLREVDRLKQSEFPYDDSRDALECLESVFRRQRDALNKLTPSTTPAVAKNACSQSLYDLFFYTPFLGFILRSTNVRNAFEVYAPVLRLARQLLNSNTKLLLSSEWDYSPFVFLPTSDLPDFALIGLPAQESSNPLLIALAGHELGHNVWQQAGLGKKFDAQIKRGVVEALKTNKWKEYNTLYPQFSKSDLETNLFARETWIPAHSWAMLQLEEVFCDAMGLRMFAESFLHAFAYILSPCTPGERAVYYPNMSSRVDFLERAATKLAVGVPPGFSDLFDTEDEPTEPTRSLLVSAADIASTALVDNAIDEAKNLADAASIPTRVLSKVNSIAKDFDLVIPADAPSTMTDILNAGWQCFHNPKLWDEIKQIRRDDRTRVLHDLILKSLEVTEVFQRVNAA